MNTRRSRASSSNRLAGPEWLSLALAALLTLPHAAFAAPTRRAGAPNSFGAHVNAAPITLFAPIVVNKTGDAQNVNPSTG